MIEKFEISFYFDPDSSSKHLEKSKNIHPPSFSHRPFKLLPPPKIL